MKGKEYASPLLLLIETTEDVVKTSGNEVWDATTKEWVNKDLNW